MLAQCCVSCAAAVLINMQTNHLPKMVATGLILDFNCCTYPLDLVSSAIDIGLVQLLCIDSWHGVYTYQSLISLRGTTCGLNNKCLLEGLEKKDLLTKVI